MGRHRRRRRGQRGADLTHQQQEDILNSLHPELRRLHLKQIFPYLNQERLLSPPEDEELMNEHFTTHDRIDMLLKWIPKKGTDALERFIVCLRKSADGTGHNELATSLEEEIRKIRQRKTRIVKSSKGKTFSMMSSFWSKVLTAAMLLIVFALLLLTLVVYFPHMRHHQVWLTYSPSLPDFIPHFLGREKEIGDLVRLLDPENTDVRTVSIVGPPGFGKSSLAIHVGHKMIDKGVVVNYVNLDEVTIDGLPEKIVGNAGITTKNDSVDRLIRWAKDDVRYPVVLILDNCDTILHEKGDDFQNLLHQVRRSATTTMMKFLLTSKHKFNILDEFAEYTLDEISCEASCKLLYHAAKVEIDQPTCRDITKLTGNVPLALKVVGAILRTRKRNITQVISNLKRELLKTLNPSDLDQKVNASLSLSYTYLNAKQRKLGRYLAIFPGSFTSPDACNILVEVMESDCNSIEAEIEVLDQRSLLQSLGKGRFQFLKEFLTVVKRSFDTKRNIGAFLTRFQANYGRKLYQFSVIFEHDYASALHHLDIEKHNIHYLLEHFKTVCVMEPEQSLVIFETIQVALENHFLTCRFTGVELQKPLTDICECLLRSIQTKILSLARKDIDYKEAKNIMRHMEVLVYMKLKLYSFNHDITPLEETKSLVDLLTGILHTPVVDDFYFALGSHYHKIGELEKEKSCHESILRRANAQLDNCLPGQESCDYYSISRAYYHLKNYELTAHFLELDLKHNEEKMSLFDTAKTLELLSTCQYVAGNRTKAAVSVTKLLHLLPSLINASVPEVYAHLQTLSRIASLFRLIGLIDEATQLEKKQIMAIKEMNATETRHEESFAVKASDLATKLFEAEQYAEVPEVAECALNLLKKQNVNNQTTIELQLKLGKAEYYNRRKIESIANLKEVARIIVYNHPQHNEMAREACQYMIAQSHFDYFCVLIIWGDFKTIVHSVFMLAVSETVTIGSFTLPHQHNEEFSTDIAPSSTYLDFLPSELATPVVSFYATILNWCMQIIKYVFYTLHNHVIGVFSISFLLCVVNYVLIVAKLLVLLLLLCVCCCGPSCCTSCCFIHIILVVLKRCTSNKY